MSVVVSLQDIGPCRKQLTVEVPAPAVEAETQRVVREFGQRVRIPGFRKGKVPQEMVRRRFAKDIEREVIDRLLPRYWRQAQAESEIDPLLPPEVEDVRDLEPGAPLTFVATVETRPQIELRNVHDFALPDPPVEPGIVDIDQAIEDLRGRLASWVPVERPAARGDLVAAELTPLGTEAGKADQVEFEVGDERVWEELSLAVSGLATGQEISFSRAADPGAGGPASPGAENLEQPASRQFRVRVTAVKERELPPLDDDLATRLNPELDGLAALREEVTRQLREVRREERGEQRQRALLDQLRERHPMELPQGVVAREVESLVHDYAHSLSQRGVNLEQAGIDWKQVREDMQALAERRVHARLLLDAIAVAESITLGDEEFERALSALARAQGATTPALRRSLDEKGRLAPLRDQLRRDKVIRQLLGEGPPAAAAEAPDTAEGGAVPESDPTDPVTEAAPGP
ncbi:MAG TPA: trigger factor [Thermoanaerobaculia bacterium]|nr:trigger factor [Thermoanaerobaculia bacterium]